jgi:quercetin dioxygenase-like cupin family protein
MRPLVSQIQKLGIPLKSDFEKGFKSIDLFGGFTANLGYLRCHASVLNKGFTPHPPHRHSDEEILVVLRGEVNAIIPDQHLPDKVNRHRLQVGQCVYYPAGLRHTIETTSEEPANYIMFKWHDSPSGVKSPQEFSIYSLFDEPLDSSSDNIKELHTRLVFEGSTGYLKRLHCHTTELASSGGYEPHSDQYDIAIIVFMGELETLGKTVGPHDVIFYKNGDVHGMSNRGDIPAFYAVFEFHGKKPQLWPGYHNLKRILLSVLNEPGSLKPRIKSFMTRLRQFR